MPENGDRQQIDGTWYVYWNPPGQWVLDEPPLPPNRYEPGLPEDPNPEAFIKDE